MVWQGDFEYAENYKEQKATKRQKIKNHASSAQ